MTETITAEEEERFEDIASKLLNDYYMKDNLLSKRRLVSKDSYYVSVGQ